MAYENKKDEMTKAATNSDNENKKKIEDMTPKEQADALAAKKGEISKEEMDEKADRLAKIMQGKEG